ncbi:uncharacterized protein [Arachis hypogaea]|uniref:uncharacterized protein n=1 Tax=Arachis hypogaea TaxID=3818 RepID=UPI003B215B39
MKPPNGRKVVLRFNSALQPVGDEAGLLSGVMGLLGSDYTKFPICERDWRKVRTRDKVYNEIVKQILKTAQMELLRTIEESFSIIAIAKRHRRSVRKMRRIDQSSFTPTPADRKAWQGSEKKSRNDKGG